jgi:hypothetical protein
MPKRSYEEYKKKDFPVEDKTLVIQYKTEAYKHGRNEKSFKNFMATKGIYNSELILLRRESKNYTAVDNFIKDYNFVGSMVISLADEKTGNAHAVCLRRFHSNEKCYFYDPEHSPDDMKRYGWGWSKFFEDTNIVQSKFIKYMQKLIIAKTILYQVDKWDEANTQKIYTFYNDIKITVDDCCFSVCVAYIRSDGSYSDALKKFFQLN